MDEQEWEEQVRQLEGRLRAIPEPPMRREQVRAWLRERDVEEGVRLLHEVLSKAPARRFPSLELASREALLIDGPGEPLDYAFRAELYEAAAATEDLPLQRLLRSPDAVQRMRDPAASLPRDLAEIPLGTRRSLARGHDRTLLEKLLLDADPVVIEHLLSNPRLTEADVTHIAARRPIPESTLRVIHHHERFGYRLGVRRAIARNPYTPTDLALHALFDLGASELREIARDGTLHEDVRAQAALELERHSPGG